MKRPDSLSGTFEVIDHLCERLNCYPKEHPSECP
jgi:hypothetical protein